MARQKKYEDNAFTNLVRALDDRWGHTYQDVPDTGIQASQEPKDATFTTKSQFVTKLYIPTYKG